MFEVDVFEMTLVQRQYRSKLWIPVMMALLEERYCEWPATRKLVLLLTIGSSEVPRKHTMIYNSEARQNMC
jgi:hypothetical protein